MTAFIALSGLLFGAAITPGPNNFIVIERASKFGPMAMATPIAAVVAGSVLLYVAVVSGVGLAGQALPAIVNAISILGAVYLAYLGASMVVNAGQAETAINPLPDQPAAIAVFQLANPKAWVLVGTVAASPLAQARPLAVAALMIAISVACLIVWGFAGAALTGLLSQPRRRSIFDRAMGAILILSAIGVAIDAQA